MAHAAYLRNIFDRENLNAEIKRAKQLLRYKKFNAIAVSGISGTFGAVLAHAMNKHLILVRKSRDGAHSTNSVESSETGEQLRFIFVDDLIATGDTMWRTIAAIAGEGINAKMVGGYWFNYPDKPYHKTKELITSFWWTQSRLYIDNVDKFRHLITE